jgi:cation diffusion facilitator CzcD-associated flavoprotein CzcO
MMKSPLGAPNPPATLMASDHTPEQRQEMYEMHWREGGLGILFHSYQDILTNKDTNEELAEFVRGKIRNIVKDPEMVKKLLPDYIFGTKRQVLDDGYFETFNRDNVTLVDLREDPIARVTPTGIVTENGEEHSLDVLVLATGYDAITGAYERLNPLGRRGVSLKEKWAERFSTYLGMTIPDFPNLFMLHGPESPSVLFNMPLGAELQSDWIRDCIHHLRESDKGAIEPAPGADIAWGQEVDDIASTTLFSETDSWYTGANIPGKHRQFAVYLGGPVYYKRLAEVAASGYEGLVQEDSKAEEMEPATAQG